MTKEEFENWLLIHSSTFPRWAEEVERLPRKSLTMANWRVAMDSVSPAAAMQATRELLEGKHGKTPFEIQGHITLIASRAKEIDLVANKPALKYADEPRSICRVCLDVGSVVIVHPQSDESELCRASAWCGCAIGQRLEDDEARIRERKSSNVSPQPSIVYDPDRHVRWTWDRDAMQKAFSEIRSRGKDRPNYVSDFDSFNQSE